MDDLSEVFLIHLRSRYHFGECSHASLKAVQGHPFCADRIQLQLVLDPKCVITEAWHHGSGCMTCLTSASILCEHIERKSLSELRDFSQQEMMSLLSIQLTPLRQQCALVAYNALQQLLKQVPEISGDE